MPTSGERLLTIGGRLCTALGVIYMFGVLGNVIYTLSLIQPTGMMTDILLLFLFIIAAIYGVIGFAAASFIIFASIKSIKHRGNLSKAKFLIVIGAINVCAVLIAYNFAITHILHTIARIFIVVLSLSGSIIILVGAIKNYNEHNDNNIK